jgi:5-methylthioribose kinase
MPSLNRSATFETYRLLTADEAADWARDRLTVFSPGATLETTEIGDGNLNYIFRVADRTAGTSVVLKQSGDTARLSDQFKVSPDRNRIEHDILVRYNALVPGLVPRVYAFDPVMNLTAMEDLSDHVILRQGWREGRSFPHAADDLAEFLARTLVATSDGVINPKEKKDLVRTFINPDLCEITEDLVFTEPFADLRRRNEVLPELKAFVEKELYGDDRLRLEAAKLKAGFLSSPQALIHGDFHTGSIFVRPDSTKVIDPEFAFFGPAGFDLGALAANAAFAFLSARAEGRPTEADAFLVRVVDRFIGRWKELWAASVTDPSLRVTGYAEWFLAGILKDAAGSAGLELCRRTVGIAHVKDLTGIPDRARRLKAETASLRLGKALILHRGRIQSGSDYLWFLLKAARREGLR